METPYLSHITDFTAVYEPAEDSFLMIDALEADLEYLQSLKPTIVVEIGSGSGVTITALAKKFGSHKSDIICFATDINLRACEMTSTTAQANATRVECVHMDLLGCFRQQLFDVVVFNPPYVVTDSAEIAGWGIARSWAGGKRGREVTDRLLDAVRRYLTPGGAFYLLTIEENDPLEICRLMQQTGFNYKLIAERKIRGEHLKVFRFNCVKIR